MSQKLVSIIIPVYNLEKYIEKCILSIVNQTYQKLEIIIIDDGSDDSSREILKSFELNDTRIKIYDGGHLGVSNARNIGLEHANGEYITFVDGDDFVCLDYIESLVLWLEANHVDIAICGTSDYNEEYAVIKQSVEQKPIIENAEQFVSNIVLCKKYTCVVWGKLYKSHILNNVRFNSEIEIAEDFDFLYRTSKNVSKVYYNSTPLYNWLLREKSAVHTAKSLQLFKSLETHEQIMSEVVSNKSLLEAVVDGYIMMNFECIRLARGEGNKSIVRKCKKKIRSKLMDIAFARTVKTKRKIKIFIKWLF